MADVDVDVVVLYCLYRQYGPSYGLPALIEELRHRQVEEHKPKYNEWEIIVSTGSQVREFLMCSRLPSTLCDPLMVLTSYGLFRTLWARHSICF